MTSGLLGIVAGSGSLPGLVARGHRAAGGRCFVLALAGAADASALDVAPDAMIGVGEPMRGFDILRAAGVSDVILVGGVKRPSLGDIKMDPRAAAFLARVALRALGDDSLLRAVGHEIEREGFRLVGLKQAAPELMAPRGPIGKLDAPGPMRLHISIGLQAARDLGRDDRGQAVVVADGIVVDRESNSGTDALIARAAHAGAVLVKCRKPQQDERFDLPAIGPATVAACARAGFAGIAVERGETVIIDRAAVAAAADQAGLFVVGV